MNGEAKPIRDSRFIASTRAMAVCFALVLSSGCAALTNPVADGVPVRLVPQELLEPSKEGYQTIPLTLLSQPQPAEYRLDTGDSLTVYVEGFLGEKELPATGVPIHVAPQVDIRDQRRLPSAVGYPITVETDGSVNLPVAGAVKVRGMTLSEARAAIRSQYVAQRLLKSDGNGMVVNLLAPRRYQVVVMRQEAATFNAMSEGPMASSKRGTGHLVDLVAYENDVLHALAASGGLPGLDACNEIIIHRSGAGVLPQMHGICPAPQVIRIPLRGHPGAPLPFGPQDIVLQSGDVVYLEGRDDELFYTGGLLPPGAFVMPRDHDLDVIEAVSRVRGSLFNGAFGGSNLSGTLISPGIGNPSPTLLVVLRRTPNGGQLPIAVDLREAMRHPEERLLVRRGDVLLLQEKPSEAMSRYFTQTFLNFDFTWLALHSTNTAGFISVAGPDRLTTPVTNLNVNPR